MVEILIGLGYATAVVASNVAIAAGVEKCVKASDEILADEKAFNKYRLKKKIIKTGASILADTALAAVGAVAMNALDSDCGSSTDDSTSDSDAACI